MASKKRTTKKKGPAKKAPKKARRAKRAERVPFEDIRGSKAKRDARRRWGSKANRPWRIPKADR